MPIDGWLNGGAESVAMYGGHIDPALATLVADPTIDEIRIHGFYFDQGEDDSNSSGTAISYETKLTTFISDIRTHVGITNLPIIIRQLDSTVSTGAIEALRTSQANVATALSNVELITGPYTYNPDNIHLDGTSQNMVGLQRYNTLISMTNGEIYNG